jgi:hypothetical protein
LKHLLAAVKDSLPRVREATTRAHLDELAARIERILDPRLKT